MIEYRNIVVAVEGLLDGTVQPLLDVLSGPATASPNVSGAERTVKSA